MKKQAVAVTYKQEEQNRVLSRIEKRKGNLSEFLEDGWLVVSSHAFDDGWIEYIVEKEVHVNDRI